MPTASVTPDNNVVSCEIEIAVPPERVFQAITDPSQLPLWWGQTEMYRVTKMESDLRVGGKWKSTGVGKDGKSFEVGGEYLEIDPPRVLVYTWAYGWGRCCCYDGSVGVGAEGWRHAGPTSAQRICRERGFGKRSCPGMDSCIRLDAGLRGTRGDGR